MFYEFEKEEETTKIQKRKFLKLPMESTLQTHKLIMKVQNFLDFLHLATAVKVATIKLLNPRLFILWGKTENVCYMGAFSR